MSGLELVVAARSLTPDLRCFIMCGARGRGRRGVARQALDVDNLLAVLTA